MSSAPSLPSVLTSFDRESMLASMPTLGQRPGVEIGWKDYSEDPECTKKNSHPWTNAYKEALACKASYSWRELQQQTNTFDESLQIPARKPLPLPELFPYVKNPLTSDFIGEKPFNCMPALTYVEAHALALGALVQVIDAENTCIQASSKGKTAWSTVVNKTLSKENNNEEVQDKNLFWAKHFSLRFHEELEESMLRSTEDMNKSCICGSIYDKDYSTGDKYSIRTSLMDEQWGDIKEKFSAYNTHASSWL